MTGLVRKATLFTACGLLIAGAAMASVPSAANSTVPCAIKVVGHDGAGPNTSDRHPIVITVRDLANNPINNSSVVIDFTNCNSARDPGPSSVQGFAGMTVDCVTKTVRALTGPTGQVTMRVAGMARLSAAGTTPSGACARIFADGVLLATVQAAAFDLNGGQSAAATGLTAADLSGWLGYFFSCPSPATQYCAIADYNYVDGACATKELTAADLSIWLGEFFSNKSIGNGTVCP